MHCSKKGRSGVAVRGAVQTGPVTANAPWLQDSRSRFSFEMWQDPPPRMSSKMPRNRTSRLVSTTGLLLMLSLLSGCLSFHRGPLPGEPKGTYAVTDGVRLRYADVQPAGGRIRAQ